MAVIFFSKMQERATLHYIDKKKRVSPSEFSLWFLLHECTQRINQSQPSVDQANQLICAKNFPVHHVHNFLFHDCPALQSETSPVATS
jgi:hypothetical protein